MIYDIVSDKFLSVYLKQKIGGEMNLVIVESPAKAKTIEKYLGKDYKVLASFGHVRDLPQKELGIDVKNDFEPDYIIPPKAKKIISELARLEKSSDALYLATDLDREGEAIAWHLIKALKLKDNDPKIKRIVFHEITKSAIENAVKHSRGIDKDLVDAQQARRILDRLVGYKLSPLLWRKVKSGLSAGRVQSVAVRLVVDREEEIRKFKSDEYWILGANLSKKSEESTFASYLIEYDGKPIKKLDIKNKKEAGKISNSLENAKYLVLDIQKEQLLRSASAPFTTSTMQMEASRKLGFSAKQTMMLAQKLYEAGHITYMRTDSINLAQEAQRAIGEIIVKEFGQKYLPEVAKVYKTKTKRAQEAHEAIRPTDFSKKEVADDPREQKLYELIWKRTVASLMKDAIFDSTSVTIEAKSDKNSKLFAKGEKIFFDGFIRVYIESKDDETEEEQNPIPNLMAGEILDFHELISEQKFTEPPKRYTEAMLVKKLESLGIGRPSTYAPTLSTIQDRGYVELVEKKFVPTEIAEIVNKVLVENFAEVVDYQFTAKMEDDLDDVAEGKKEWVPVIREFYEPFAKNLTEKGKELEKKDIIQPKELKEKCPECKKPLMERLGRYGKFIACSGYPECKYSRPLDDGKKMMEANEDGKPTEVDEKEKCEKCGGKMVLKEGRFGRFFACENYPKCKFTKTIITSSGIKCPECGEGELIEKRTKKGRMFWGCSRYPGCKYASWTDPKKPKEEDTGEQIENQTSDTDEK